MQTRDRPALDRHHVHRPRLTDRIAATPEARLTLVAGPAGSGSTSLVREWLETSDPGDVAWVCLEPVDGAEHDLCAAVVAALADVDPGLAADLQAAHDAGADPEVVAGTLATGVAGRSRRLTLVFDGLHHVSDPAMLGSLAGLVDVMGPRGHVLATSRTLPRVPLARWQAAGRAAVIDGEQLALTRDEVAAVLDRHGVGDPDGQLAAGLSEHAAGWCAIVRLAAMAAALAPSSPAEELLAATASVAAFVRDEVLPGLAVAERDLLVRTAFAESLSPSFVDGVLDTTESGQLLRSLADERRLLRRDGASRYQIHPVLRSVLLEEFEALGAEERWTLRRRGVERYEAEGAVGDAVQVAVATRDSELIFEVCRRHIGELFNLGLSGIARDAVLLIPDAVVGDDPVALLDHAELLAYCGFTTRAHEVMLRIESLPDVDDAVLGRIALGRAVATGFRGELTGALEWTAEAERRLGLLPSDVLGLRARINLARSLRLAGRATEARELLASIGAPLAASDPFAEAAIGARAEVQYEVGDLTGAAALAAEAIAGWQGRGAPEQFLMNDALRTLGLCRLEAGDLAGAHEWLGQALRLTDLIPPGIPRATTQFALMAIDRFEGHASAAAERLVDVRTWAREGPHGPVLRSRVEDAEAELWLAGGDPERAWQILADGVEADIRNARRPLVAATVAIELGRTGDAQRLLAASEHTTVSRRVERHLVVAELALAEGDGATALDEVRAALALGAPAGFRFTIASRRRLLPQLRELDRTSPSPALNEILRLADPSAPAPGEDVPRLSPRESEILQLLPTHLSTQAIADRAHVSPHTVKTHLKHIYRKLGAANRAEAVEIATRRGLLVEP